MRKLTDIISSIDQYNGLGPYSDEYKGGKQVDMETEYPDTPKEVIITETLENIIRNLLELENISERIRRSVKTETCEVSHLDVKVLTFENFIAEKRGVNMPSNVQSYFGGIDDADDDEFIEEE